MDLTILILHLVIAIFILIIVYWICKRKKQVPHEEPLNAFNRKLKQIEKRLEKISEEMDSIYITSKYFVTDWTE